MHLMIEFALGVISTIALEAVAIVVIGVKLALNDRKEGKGSEKENPVPAGAYTDGSKWYDGTS